MQERCHRPVQDLSGIGVIGLSPLRHEEDLFHVLLMEHALASSKVDDERI